MKKTMAILKVVAAAGALVKALQEAKDLFIGGDK